MGMKGHYDHHNFNTRSLYTKKVGGKDFRGVQRPI
jgi:hypothetical protein